ncbi:MAG: hypothetical protein IKP31_05450 [Lachnospiraceae bacterium]|nr:hypothetical protein [Lachnospiraceae bacterium]
MERELGKARVELLDASRKLEEAEETLNAKEVEYREGEQELKNGRRKLDKGWNEYNEGINKLDKTLNIATIDEIIEVLVQFDGTERLVSELNVLKSEGPLERAYHLLAYYDELETELDDIVIGAEFIDTIIETGNEDKEEKIVPEDIVEEIKAVINEFVDIDDFRRNLSRLSDAKKELEDGEKEYKEGKEELRAGREKLDAGWKEFEEGKKKFEGGQEEYNSKEADALKQLADAEAELEDGKKEGARQLAKARETYASEKRKADEQLADYTKKLEEGKEEYNKRKKEGEKELADADQEYEDGKKQAYEQLDELKAQIEEAKSLSCEWIVQTRNTNLYYMELASTCKVLLSVSIVFAAIYALVVAIVCFFTMAIVVEEQTDQIGVCKAFGFYVSEIRIKYLIFGVTAAFTGAIIGDFIAPFVERLITESLSESYIFGIIQHKPVLFPFLILPVGAVLVTSFAVIWSSRKIIARPAVHLLNGSDPNKKPKKKATKENKGGIYTRLIINNFMMDMGRETVSIFIILICCALIGLGTTIRLSYSGAMDQQIDDILIYDISATMTEEITEEERDKFVETISGYPYIGVCKSGGILQNDEGQTLTELYCVEDTESFSEFFALKDKKGEILNVPKEGILATLEMKEKDSLETGSNVTLINKDLHSVEVYPQGFFLLHMGKVIVMSSDYYRELYGEDPVINTYLIKSGESGTDALTEKLYKLDGISDITRTDSIISQYANVTGLYNVLVLVVLGFSIILSFMILLNLSNILVKHRIKELLTMRVNGFAYVQVVGYLVREIIVTTSLGILLGLLVGMPATSAILPAIESNGFMFLRRIFPAAWALAISCNVIFAVIINWLAFKKIKKVPLTDITKY